LKLQLGEADIHTVDVVENVTDEDEWDDSEDDLFVQVTFFSRCAERELRAFRYAGLHGSPPQK
jgi:hypothetical protein